MNDYDFYENVLAGNSNQIYDYFPVIGPNGDFKMISGIDVLINALRNLLLTPLGQYPFDPNFGSLLYKQVFEPHDNITLTNIKFECEQRIKRYFPKIQIIDVSLFSNKSSTGETKSVRVDISIKRNRIPGNINLVIPNKQNMFGSDEDLNPELQNKLNNQLETLMKADKLYQTNFTYKIMWDAEVKGKKSVSTSERIVIHNSICKDLGIGV